MAARAEHAIYSKLSTTLAITQLVGSRIYPNVIPQTSTYPAIRYQRISGPRVHSLTGPSGLASPRFQIDAVAQSYLEAGAVADAVRVALDGFRGVVAGVSVEGVIHLDERDFDFDEGRLQVVSDDYRVWHQE